MSETTWQSATAEPLPPKKKSVPTWVWVCGTGCLVLVLCGVLATVLAWRFINKAKDPEVQWPKVAAVLPLEKPYPTLTIFGWPIPGASIWSVFDPTNRSQTTIMNFTGDDAAQVKKSMFDPSQEVGIAFLGNVGRHEVEVGKIKLQGREYDCVRYQTLPKKREEPQGKDPTDDGDDGIMSKMRRGVEGATIVVDMTPPGASDLVLLQYQKVRTLERVSDEELEQFLAPFHFK